MDDDTRPPEGDRIVPISAGKRRRANGHAPPDLECIRLAPVGAANLPPRPWAYGRFMLFGSASVIGAVDGAGKGAIAVVMLLAFITGQPLLGEKVWRSGPVAIITYEDDETEWHRRIAAACLLYRLDYDVIMANVHFIRRPGGKVSFAAMADGAVVGADGDAIIAHLKAIGAVMLIIDPFNHAHTLGDGNNNALVAWVAGEISRVAAEAGVAVLLLHHLRKGANGSVDDLMGATSLRATFRSCRILSRMTKEEADALNINAKERPRYIRIVSSKENYAPPPELATWFKIASVPLGNPAGVYEEGDDIGVVTRWSPPDVFEDMPLGTLAEIFDRIRQGPGEGEFYSPTRAGKSTRWVGSVVTDLAGKSPEQADIVVGLWIKNAVLIEGTYPSPKGRRDAQKVTLNEAKAAAILAPLRPDLEGGNDVGEV